MQEKFTTRWLFAEALSARNAPVSLKTQHAQTDASQTVPGLGTVPTHSLTIYVCGAERAKSRDPASANRVCEESIVDHQRPVLAADQRQSTVVMYVNEEFVMATVTAAGRPAQGLYDLEMVAEH